MSFLDEIKDKLIANVNGSYFFTKRMLSQREDKTPSFTDEEVNRLIPIVQGLVDSAISTQHRNRSFVLEDLRNDARNILDFLDFLEK